MSQFDQSITLPLGVQLKNRLMLSPVTTQLSFFNDVITEDEITYHKQRSKGLGAVITGAANVQDIGKDWPGELSTAHDEMIPRLNELAKVVQGDGVKAIVQIFHGGRVISRATLPGEQSVSINAVAAERPDTETPRALSENEIKKTIQVFDETTRRAIESGFDGIELYGANMYLIQRFFSPHSNRREDQWDGSLENRYRFIDELLTTVFSTVEKYTKKPFIVEYRFSPKEYEAPGTRFEDTIWFLERLRETKLDYLHASLNTYDRRTRSDKYSDQSILEAAHDTIQGKTPLIGVGDIRTRKDVEQVLKYAELAAIGRQMIVDPDQAKKLLESREDEFVTKPFKEAHKKLYLPSPLYNFLKTRYR